jgi:flagellum-specific ATP synthase
VLTAYENAELMIQTGLYAPGSDPAIDEAIKLWPRLDAFFAERAPDGVEDSFERLTRIVGGGAIRKDGMPAMRKT